MAGGFIAGKTDAGAPIIRNPATRSVMELLDNVLVLARFLPRSCQLHVLLSLSVSPCSCVIRSQFHEQTALCYITARVSVRISVSARG